MLYKFSIMIALLEHTRAKIKGLNLELKPILFLGLREVDYCCCSEVQYNKQ